MYLLLSFSELIKITLSLKSNRASTTTDGDIAGIYPTIFKLLKIKNYISLSDCIHLTTPNDKIMWFAYLRLYNEMKYKKYYPYSVFKIRR